MDYQSKYSKEYIWELLSKIPDPEIPVITITDLGVVRAVDIEKDKINISITPTYTGCPAMKLFEEEIIETLNKHGIENVSIKMVFAPAWTTDWLSEEAKEKLRKYGIAPPVDGTQDKGILFEAGPKTVNCPKCNSTNTTLKSQFGSTACKALYVCNNCKEPFEYFKCI
ncbi:MAG: phenylacetate-CoA oxygenase subunit PaaJ [Vicingaceae bacterium]